MQRAPQLQGFLELHIANQHVGQTTIGVEAEVVGEPGSSQIGVDHGDGCAALGQHDGKIHKRRGFTLPRDRGCHQKAAATGVGVGVGELQVGAKHPERLSAGGRRTDGCDDRGGARFERDTAEHRNDRESFDVVAVVDAAVEQPQDEGGDEAHQQSGHQADGEVEVEQGQRGVVGGDSGVEHADRDRARTPGSGRFQLVDDDVGETLRNGLRELLRGIRR